MSTRDDKTDSRKKQTKLKKKAQSFKDEIRDKFSNIKRLQGLGARSPSPQKMSPVKSPKKKGIGRHNSFNEASHTEKTGKETDLVKLQNEEHKVRQALKWFQNVVDKRTLQMLPGCATVVLETIMEMHQILANFCINRTSTMLMSTYNKLYQSLANLIKWADYILINGDKSLNSDAANEIIKEVQEGIKDLISLAADKLENGKQGSYQTLPTPRTPKTPKSPTSPLANYNTSVASSPRSSLISDRSSLPDLPLTQHELDILEETSQSRSSQYSNMSASSEDILDCYSDTTPVGSPPPKPPLPEGFEHSLISEEDESSLGSDGAPPLPSKRTSNGSSYNERLSMLSGNANSNMTDSPRTSIVCTSQPAVQGHSVLETQATLNAQSPLSQSPTNSACSILSGSSEEVEKPNLVSTAQRLSSYDNVKTVNSSTTVLRSREVVTCVKKTIANVKVITKGGVVTTEIISSDMADGGDMSKAAVEVGEGAPPLPDKHAVKQVMTRMGSLYDNVPEEGENKDSDMSVVKSEPPALQAKVGESTAIVVSQQSSMFQQSFVQTSMQSYSGSSHRTLQMRHSPSISSIPGRSAVSMISETSMSYSSSETVSTSSGTGSIESISKAPPLPPKTRNIQAYMQMFGKVNTTPSLHGLHEISRHSVNFYRSQFSQHQMDLFVPYQKGVPRSNTIGSLSTASSRTSDTISLISSSSGDEHQGFYLPAPSLPPKLRKGNASPPKGRKEALTIDTRKAISLTDEAPLEKQDLPKRISEPVSPTEKEQRTSPLAEIQKDTDSDFSELSTLDDIDVSDQLIRRKGEDGPEIRGGALDALIVHATIAAKNDFMYQEAFLTTYRTFITPKELIEKLIQRYSRFARIDDNKRKKLARNTFSLLIRVVDELCTEIGEEVIKVLMDLVFQLLCDGELMLARIMRKKKKVPTATLR